MNKLTLNQLADLVQNRKIKIDTDDLCSKSRLHAFELAKLICYLNGTYDFLHEAKEGVKEFCGLGLTKPYANKIDVLMNIFNDYCTLHTKKKKYYLTSDMPEILSDKIHRVYTEYRKQDFEYVKSKSQKILKNQQIKKYYEELTK